MSATIGKPGGEQLSPSWSTVITFSFIVTFTVLALKLHASVVLRRITVSKEVGCAGTSVEARKASVARLMDRSYIENRTTVVVTFALPIE
jgi:hypothetical protein